MAETYETARQAVAEALGPQIEGISGGLRIARSEIGLLREAIRDSDGIFAARADATRTVIVETLGALGERINALAEEIRRTREMIEVGKRLPALEMRAASESGTPTPPKLAILKDSGAMSILA